MRALVMGALVCVGTPSLSGCVAALPLAAAGVIGKSTFDRRGQRGTDRRAERVVERVARSARRPPSPPARRGTGTPSAASVAALEGVRAGALQDATGPGDETGAPWAQMTAYALGQARSRASGREVPGAVLAQASPLDKPVFVPCGAKPVAVLVDLDGTTSLSAPLDPGSVPAPTTSAAVRLHEGGVAVGWLSDRPSGQADDVRGALTRAGLWADGDRLLLNNGKRKQERRLAASQDLCVVAQLGDTAADMDELFDYLRDPDAAKALDPLFNQRWYLAAPTIAGQE